jgi:glycosyltransferase involved in cell wall biosynthesis
MRIVHVVDSMDVGGAEMLVSLMCRKQRARGDEPRIFAVATLGALGQRMLEDGFAVHTHLGRSLPDGLRNLYRAFREFRPDVVHLHNPTPTIYGAPAARLAGVRRVLTTRHSLVAKPRRAMVELKYAAATVFCDRVVGICDATVANLKSMHMIAPRKIVRVYNGVLPLVRTAEPDRPAKEGFTLLFVGRLEPVKNHVLLLHAFAAAHARNARLRLWMVGDGSERARLKDLAGTLGVSSSITFWGQQLDVAPFYSAADLYVMSSRSEGLPMSLLQAISIGLPSVVTDVGGMAEVVRLAAAGMTVPLDDPGRLAEAILHLAADSNARAAYAANAEKAFADHFTLDSMMSAYQSCYESATSQPEE